MFNFRIIDTADGNQIIDRRIKTPYNALTPIQMVEYLEMDNRLAYMDRMERKAKAEAERRRKIADLRQRSIYHYSGMQSKIGESWMMKTNRRMKKR